MRMQSKRLIFPFALFVLALLLIWQYRASGKQAYAAETSVVRDGLTIRIETLNDSVITMKPAHFRIEARDETGNPAKVTSAKLKIEMPDMFCGEFRAEAVPTDSGRFEATVVPVMNGVWEAEAEVRIADRTYVVEHRFQAGK